MSEEETPAEPGTQSEGAAEGAEGQRQELPTWNRGKSKRKAKAEAVAEAEVAEGDVFTRGMADAGRAAASQSKLLAIGAVVLLGVIGGVVFFRQTTSQASAEATRSLATLAATARARKAPEEIKNGKNPPPNPVFVDDADRDKQFADALAAAKGADDAEVQALAGLVEASSLFQSGEYDAALAVYDGFLASHPSDHPMAFVAKEGRGLVMEAKGDLEGALSVFEAMTAQDVAEQFYSDMALWHQGRLLERLDRKADAVAVYKRYQELYPDTTRPSVAADKVRARLAELDVPAADAAKAADAPAKAADGGSTP